MSKKEILNILAANQRGLRGFGVRRLALFGSLTRGEETASSDADFLVELERKTFDAYMDLKFFLEDLLQRPVDLVTTDAVKERLRESILKESVHVPGL